MLILVLRLTLFVSAFLLFCCQPMIAKMVLPRLGGSASVWTTCVLFFQAMLLAGYVYAHGIGRLPRFRTQFAVHGTLMLAVLAFLPIGFAASPGRITSEYPAIWLLVQLGMAVGVPFFAVSATAPLLQTWLARTGVEERRDPYFLYAASNAGSLLSLVVYPLLVEPRLGLQAQSLLWTSGYAFLLMMMAATAVLVTRHSGSPAGIKPVAEAPAPQLKTRAFWTAAAFVPSALMLAVTNHISVNLASVPFLWIVPLALYLLTFIMAFAKTARISHARLSRFSPIVFLSLLLLVPDVAPLSPTLNLLLMAGHAGVLFFGALLCHTALAERRPAPQHLTEFYFWIALGGALGGIFTALIAPSVFKTVFEYPLLVAMLPFFRQSDAGETWSRRLDFIFPALLGVLFAAVWYSGYTSIVPDVLFFVALLTFRKRRVRFAMGFGVLLIGYVLTVPAFIEGAQRLHVDRNFFGVKKVLFDKDRNMRKLIHGEILHGVESMEPQRMGVPLSYYHPTGPVGDVMNVIGGRPEQIVGVVGLGTGSVAAYAGPNRHIIFFDIDAQVEWIARKYFTFLERCAANCDVVIGDGRLAIEQTADRTFDLILLDAFSSDSIPAHLVSREAIRLYETKLKPDGLLLFHVSNKYLNVGKLVAAAAGDAGLVAYLRSDRDQSVDGKSGSDYAVAAKHLSDLGILPIKGTWARAPVENGVSAWTDDYSNMLSLLRWGN